jgi:hypothetical protein
MLQRNGQITGVASGFGRESPNTCSSAATAS